MSGFEFTSTNTTPKAGLTGDTDNEASDIHNVRSLIAADFAFLVDRSPSCINIVVDDAIRGKESFTGKFEHRLRTTVFLLTPDGRGVEAVLARFVHEKREDTHRITMSQLHWAALDKIVSD